MTNYQKSYSPYFLSYTDMQSTVQWCWIKNLVCKLDQHLGYNDWICISCFYYSAINNPIPRIQRFSWKIKIFMLQGKQYYLTPVLSESVVQALHRYYAGIMIPFLLDYFFRYSDCFWCAVKALTEILIWETWLETNKSLVSNFFVNLLGLFG